MLQYPASLRMAAALPNLLQDEGLTTVEGGAGPTPQGGRLWLLRIGLFELQRPKEQADDWVWIVDHTVQLGTVKVLLIVGLRLSQWERQERGPLGHHDLQVVLMEPTEKSDGDLVQAQLERAAAATGVPRAILSDGCRELKRNSLVSRDARGNRRMQDLKHKLARLLEGELTKDQRWPAFLQTCAHLRKKTQQTEWAFVAPPASKEKARFMNLGELIRWAAKSRCFLDAPKFPTEFHPASDRLEELLSPLREYDAALPEWHEMIELISQSMDEVRQQGYHCGLKLALQGRLPPARTPAATRLVEQILEFAGEQSAQARPGEHLPGSSEAIESLIGKGKRLEGQHSKGGFTRMVLGMAAAVVQPTTDYIQQAFDQVQTVDVLGWARLTLGPSLHALRRQTLGRITRTNPG
jgi:hypothetical protein